MHPSSLDAALEQAPEILNPVRQYQRHPLDHESHLYIFIGPETSIFRSGVQNTLPTEVNIVFAMQAQMTTGQCNGKLQVSEE